MPDGERHQLRRVHGAAVALPEQDGTERRQHRNQPSGEQHQRFRGDAKERRHALLQFELQRAALPVARNESDGNKREQENSGEFAGAERRSPNPDEWRQRLAHARGGAVQSADFGVGVDGADERYSDQRSHAQE